MAENEHVFKIRSCEFTEDEAWTKSCLNELKNGSKSSSVSLDPKSKRNVCFFEMDGSLKLYSMLRKKQKGQIMLAGDSLTGAFMYAWNLYLKSGDNTVELAFDPAATVYSKVSSSSGDIRSMRQKFHGVVSSDSRQSAVHLKGAQRPSNLATALACVTHEDAVDLLLKSKFFYLCQRNNFNLSPDQFFEVQPQMINHVVDSVVCLKRVENVASTETSNNVEVELVRLLEEPLFRLFLDHLADQCEEHACIQERHDEDDDEARILVSWGLVQTLVRFMQEAHEERKTIIEDMKKKKVVLAIYRYFHESEPKSFTSNVTLDNPLMFRLKTVPLCTCHKCFGD